MRIFSEREPLVKKKAYFKARFLGKFLKRDFRNGICLHQYTCVFFGGADYTEQSVASVDPETLRKVARKTLRKADACFLRRW
jgi:hypothetical protein